MEARRCSYNTACPDQNEGEMSRNVEGLTFMALIQYTDEKEGRKGALSLSPLCQDANILVYAA